MRMMFLFVKIHHLQAIKTGMADESNNLVNIFIFLYWSPDSKQKLQRQSQTDHEGKTSVLSCFLPL